MNDLCTYMIALLATSLAGLGIVLGAFAEDSGMYLFGLSLTVFGVLFDFFLLKKYYDGKEKAIAHVKKKEN